MKCTARNRTLGWLLFPFFLAACSSGGGDDTTGEAEVTEVEPLAVDRQAATPFTVTGTGLVAPAGLFFLDEEGEVVASSFAAVATDGTSATGTTPLLDGPAVSIRLRMEFRNGDGAVIPCPDTMLFAVENPSIDGTGNNETNPDFGSAGIALLRLVPSAYADGDAALAGADRPNPRAISNAVLDQEGSVPNSAGASDYLWQWGQFLDHDIDLSPEAEPAEEANVLVPAGDVDFDPENTGAVVIHFARSAFVAGSSPREQTNVITAFIDASNVYGSDAVRAAALRTLDGTGRLKTSAGNLLPFNVDGLPNAGGTDASLFLAGDVRANEQIGLTAMHTLFVREHNRLADDIRARHPDLSGDEVYESARRIVAAQMQVITYEEFLPLLLGRDALEPYSGYDDTVNAGIANVFSTAAYRLGHSLLSSQILRLDAAGDEIAEGHLPLRDAFFNPTRLATEGGIEPILRGLAAQAAQELDSMLVDDVRNFLFGPPGAGGFDLAVLNIQRGRDHGLGSYNDAREAFGLPRVTSFAEVSSDAAVQTRLSSVYGSVDEIDVWVGGLAEDHRPGALVGELFFTILKDQFERLRDGDRFFYKATFSGTALAEIQNTRLSDIIRRNTEIGSELSRDVFRVDSLRQERLSRDPRPLTALRIERLRSWIEGRRNR